MVYCEVLACFQLAPLCSSCARRVCVQHHENGTSLVYDGVMSLHRAHPNHPEKAERINGIWERLIKSGLAARCSRIPARAASTSELLQAHTPEHLQQVNADFGVLGITALQKELFSRVGFRLYGDLFYSPGTAKAAAFAAGSAIELALQVVRGHAANGFAVVRPPGHHAGECVAQGFCFYNNVALAALSALNQRLPDGQLVERVLIVDWDVHHGNGTQDILYGTKQVLYSSLHRYGEGFYPVTGHSTDVGGAGAEGFNVNVCLQKGSGDADYLEAFRSVLMPVFRAFAPQLVLVSAGFDACEGDPLGEMHVSPAGFAEMTRQLCTLAQGRVVLALEGGYDVDRISACAAACVQVLVHGGVREEEALKTPSRETLETLDQLREIHKTFWPCLLNSSV